MSVSLWRWSEDCEGVYCVGIDTFRGKTKWAKSK